MTALRRAVAVLGFALSLGTLDGVASAGQQLGKPAAEIALPDAAQKTVRLSELRGKVVLVDFWASWCEPCLRELPELEKLHKQLASRGVVVIGVNIDRERKNADDLIGRHKLSFVNLFDPKGQLAEIYDPPKMPTSYLIDAQGTVRLITEGFSGPADILKIKTTMEQLLVLPAK